MDLNYLAFFLISFIPLMLGRFWYRPQSSILKWSGEHPIISQSKWNIAKYLWAFILSITLIYGYINLIIHQMGFYELFFTDIMMGKEEAQQIVDEFLAQYRYKHRHLGHGIFHGFINAFVFALPFVGFFAMLENKGYKFYLLHLSYWLVTSMIVGGLISEFV